MKSLWKWFVSLFKDEVVVPQRQWTIQVFYDARDDKDKSFRATSVYHVIAEDVGKAYDKAENDLGKNYKLGAILPGKHLRFP